MTHDDITNALHNYTSIFPNITRLFSIGKSVEGRELWVLEISVNVYFIYVLYFDISN